jgi:ketosteroid isomerase-like protein
MAHPNEDLVRRGYAAFGTGDIVTLRELFADKIVWHVGGRSPIAGDYKGKDEVLGFFAQLAQRAGGTFRVDVHDVLANDEHVVALVKVTAAREGKTLDDTGAQVFHVQAGKVTESWFHPGDAYADDEFWS